ncbi:AAA domain-containing protein [Verrucomicrobiaceae bacterium 227]
MLDDLTSLRDEVLQERDLQTSKMRRLWKKALPDRVRTGRALARLVISSIDPAKRLIHFHPPAEDFAIFQEEQSVRLSQDDPIGQFHQATFIGLTTHGLTVACSHHQEPAFIKKAGWCMDEDLIDLSSFYLKAIDDLANESHGREKVYPVLFEEQETTIDGEIYDQALDKLEPLPDLNESQTDAVAIALASSPFHLIQGPPGTGKTHTLARLVEELTTRGERILITGFTHRAIHNALAKIRTLLPPEIPVIKISRTFPAENLPFPVFKDLSASKLDQHPGPYVIGATPFALYTKRLETAHFDSAVFDETSQLTLPAAIMAMMKSDQWFFFGDHRQLPPVTLLHADDPSRASVFASLIKQCRPTTLNTTYRMNAPLAAWPAGQFYSSNLTSANPHHRLALKSPPTRFAHLLDRDPSLIAIPINAPGYRSRNPEESEAIAELTLALLESGLPPSGIGIVSPFRAQVSLLRKLLRGDRFHAFPDVWKHLTVDTVERFQGQEREVILFSFTASDHEFLRRTGSFLLQAPRMNVAVTRARTKVIFCYSEELRTYAEDLTHHHEGSATFLSLLDEATQLPL